MTTPTKKPVTKKMPLPVTEEEHINRYNQLRLRWERTPCEWNAETKTKVGIAHGVGQTAKDHTDKHGVTRPATGFLIHTDGLLLIDVDAKNEHTDWLRSRLEPIAKMMAKTPKEHGYHFTFKAHPLIVKSITNINGVGIDTKTGNSVQMVAPTAFDKEGTMVRYHWLKLPNTLDELPEVPQDVVEFLLRDHRLGATPTRKIHAPPLGEEFDPDYDDSEAVLTLPDVNIIRRDETPIDVMVDKLCSCLTPTFLADYNQWLRLGLCLKTIGDGDALLAIFLKHSRRAGNGVVKPDGTSRDYDTDAMEEANRTAWADMKPNGRINLGSLKYWAKKEDKEAYFAISKELYWSLIESNDACSYCEMFYSAMDGYIIYSHGHKGYYIFNDTKGLWEKANNEAKIHRLFSETLKAILHKMLAETIANEEMDVELKGARLKKLKKGLDQVKGSGVVMLTRSFLPAFCSPDEDENDPALYFNQLPGLLPLENGVWNFKEARLLPYDRNHFFTFKIRIRYNPKADTTLIRRAVMDWFHDDKALADFVKYWCGYCLTPDVVRQQFLIVIGTSAGNGKSLLWETIMMTLLGYDNDNPDPYKSFFHGLSAEAMANMGGNNDGVYQLNGKRYALVTEPSKKQAKAIDTEQLKQLTGDANVKASAKYQNELTFKMKAKVVIPCNHLPQIDLSTQKAMIRRALVLEQNVSFHIDEASLNQAPKKERDAGWHKLRDQAFVNDLLANKEGLMLWALEGATEYVNDPYRAPPPVMFAFKDKAIDKGDVIGSWLKATVDNYAVMEDGDGPEFRPPGWKRAVVRFSDLRTEMMKGDNKWKMVDIFERAVALGYQVAGRADKGDAKILTAGLVSEREGFDE